MFDLAHTNGLDMPSRDIGLSCGASLDQISALLNSFMLVVIMSWHGVCTKEVKDNSVGEIVQEEMCGNIK